MGTSINSRSVSSFSGGGLGGVGIASPMLAWHSAALGLSVGRLAELGVAIKPALDRQTVVGLGGLDDITDKVAWIIALVFPQKWDRRATTQ